MDRRTKRIIIALWILMGMSLTVMVGAGLWRARHATPQMESSIDIEPHWTVPAFEALDQNGNRVSNADLAGKVWLADFIFTRCAGPCPLMTMRMAQIQEALGSAPVTLVSFTVDPAYDSPQVLKAYMADRGADERNWLMLNTGSDEGVKSLARDMNIGVHKPEQGEIVHGTHFILTDGQGRIRGYFSGIDGEGWKKAVEKAKQLAAGQ